MYVCMYVSMYVCMYVCMYVSLSSYTYIKCCHPTEAFESHSAHLDLMAKFEAAIDPESFAAIQRPWLRNISLGFSGLSGGLAVASRVI